MLDPVLDKALKRTASVVLITFCRKYDDVHMKIL